MWQGEPVDVLRATVTTDRYGKPVQDWTTPARVTVPGVVVAPRDAEGEPLRPGRQSVITGLSLYFPPGSDVRATDRLEVRGELHEVDGPPGDWRNPWDGVATGLEVNAKRVEG